MIRQLFCVSVLCRPFVEYKGVIPPDKILDKQNELEREANRLISEGAKVDKQAEYVELHIIQSVTFKSSPFLQVLASVFPYEEAAILCGGSLPSYISKVSPAHFLDALSLLVPNVHSASIIGCIIHLNDLLVNNIPLYFLLKDCRNISYIS